LTADLATIPREPLPDGGAATALAQGVPTGGIANKAGLLDKLKGIGFPTNGVIKDRTYERIESWSGTLSRVHGTSHDPKCEDSDVRQRGRFQHQRSARSRIPQGCGAGERWRACRRTARADPTERTTASSPASSSRKLALPSLRHAEHPNSHSPRAISVAVLRNVESRLALGRASVSGWSDLRG
jgi:hypothetical protein